MCLSLCKIGLLAEKKNKRDKGKKRQQPGVDILIGMAGLRLD